METKLLIIDRIEGDFVICEKFLTGETLEIKRTDIITSFEEGDILFEENEKYKVDIQKSIKRKIEMKTKFDSIW